MNDTTAFIVFRFSLITLETAVFVFLFLLNAKKRKLWILKSILCVLLVIGITIGLSFAAAALYASINYESTTVGLIGGLIQLLILVLLGCGFYFCFDVTLYELGSILSLGYATRWIIFSLYSLVLNFANPNLFLIRIGQQTPLNILIYVLTYAAYIGLTCYMVITKYRGKSALELPAFISLLVIIFLNTFLLSFAETYSEDHLLEYSYVLISNIISLSLIIAINYFTQRQLALAIEKDLIQSALAKQMEQYKFVKANAEMLHVKAHDLKHQVAILRKGGEEAEQLLKSLESVVYDYESIVLTDNPVINVILSEKWQYCVKHKIKMTYSVDPKALGKLEAVELYSMLGNILDNAIEAVMKIKEKEKRIISLSISYQHGVSAVQCYNYYIGEIQIKDGLPLTSKGDQKYHGYGMKSIRSIASKYDGEMTFTSNDGIFNLLITILDH